MHEPRGGGRGPGRVLARPSCAVRGRRPSREPRCLAVWSPAQGMRLGGSASWQVAGRVAAKRRASGWPLNLRRALGVAAIRGRCGRVAWLRWSGFLEVAPRGAARRFAAAPGAAAVTPRGDLVTSLLPPSPAGGSRRASCMLRLQACSPHILKRRAPTPRQQAGSRQPQRHQQRTCSASCVRPEYRLALEIPSNHPLTWIHLSGFSEKPTIWT